MCVHELSNSRQQLFSALLLSFLILACSSGAYADQVTTASTKNSVTTESRIVITTRVGYGEKCNRDIDCASPLLCSNRGCNCPYYYIYLPGSLSTCYPGVNPGFRCQYNEQCRNNDINSYCSSTEICQCNLPYKNKNWVCVYNTDVNDPPSTNGFTRIVLLIMLVGIIAFGVGLACLVWQRKKAIARTPRRIIQSVNNGPRYPPATVPMGPPPTVPMDPTPTVHMYPSPTVPMDPSPTMFPDNILPSYVDIMNNSNNQTKSEPSPPPSYFTLQEGFCYPQPQVPYTTQNCRQQNTTVYPNNQGPTNRAFGSENPL